MNARRVFAGRLIATLLLVVTLMLPTNTARATTTVLYDATLGSVPASQGWTSLLKNPLIGGPSAIETAPDPQSPSPAVTFDSTASDAIQGGYSRSDQPLDRARGYTLRFDVELVAEDHSNANAQKNKTVDKLADRAGLSLIALSSDARGIELGFWTDDLTTTDRIWAQNDGSVEPSTGVPTGTLFTHGEGAAFTTTVMTRYDLVVQGDSYRLYAGGVYTTPLLTGPLRDYSASTPPPFGPNPYTVPNFIFIGDDTTSARGKFRLARVEMTDSALDAAPTVSAIARVGVSPTNSAALQYRVSFDMPVSGVSADDFVLTSSGVSGAALTDVAGAGDTYTVTVASGSGDGLIRLDLRDDDSIVSAAAKPLYGPGSANDPIAGEVFVIDKTSPSAELRAPTTLPAGSAVYSFTVIYSDSLALDTATLSATLRARGPGGFEQPAIPTGVDAAARSVSYQLAQLGRAWGSADSGTYTITLPGGLVRDSAGNALAGVLGSAQISVTASAKADIFTYLSLVLR